MLNLANNVLQGVADLHPDKIRKLAVAAHSPTDVDGYDISLHIHPDHTPEAVNGHQYGTGANNFWLTNPTVELLAIIGCALVAGGSLTMRTYLGDGRAHVTGYYMHAGDITRLTAEQVFAAYCTDADTGQALPPEPGVDHIGAPALPGLTDRAPIVNHTGRCALEAFGLPANAP